MAERWVLAIGDDWRIRKLIRANLEPLGLEVREAVGTHYLLHSPGSIQPDLILLDLELPDALALQVLESFPPGPDGRRIPVIVMSEEPPSRQLMQEFQVIGHLEKPFAAPALLEQVRLALGGALPCD
jgi:CheY-like chemotaxis protein